AANVISKTTKKVLFKANTEIAEDEAKALDEHEVQEAVVRSPLTCKLSYGICAMCYGWDFSTKKMIGLGVPVGVMAAQSIGEPGTQLTMRVKHAGGIVMADVTQGLPRVEELFEMRTPKNLAPVTEISGKVKIETTDEGYKIHIRSTKVKPI